MDESRPFNYSVSYNVKDSGNNESLITARIITFQCTSSIKFSVGVYFSFYSRQKLHVTFYMMFLVIISSDVYLT